MSNPRALRLNSEDNVVISVDEIRPGEAPAGAPPAAERIPRGHKMATIAIETGSPVRKFGRSSASPRSRSRRGSGCTSTIA